LKLAIFKKKKPPRKPRVAKFDPELDKFARALLLETCERFPMGYDPILSWRSMPVTAGVAEYQTRTIGLSAKVLIDEERVRVTLLHEYAHLLAVARKGMKEKGHGPAWRQAMVDLGLKPEVHHQYDVQRNQKRRVVVYRCIRCAMTFEKSRRFPQGRRYLHRGCGGALHLDGIMVATSDGNHS
jgi:predicted SprT family Zn-dependent metalloprotease